MGFRDVVWAPFYEVGVGLGAGAGQAVREPFGYDPGFVADEAPGVEFYRCRVNLRLAG